MRNPPNSPSLYQRRQLGSRHEVAVGKDSQTVQTGETNLNQETDLSPDFLFENAAATFS